MAKDIATNQIDFISKSSTTHARYARFLAEAGLFVDWESDDPNSTTVDRTYNLSGGMVIHQKGPRLTLKDEDSLLGIFQLCQDYLPQSEEDVTALYKLVNEANKGTINSVQLLPKKNVEEKETHEIPESVIASALQLDIKLLGLMTPSDLNKFLRKSTGGKNDKMRAESIRKLSETMISIEDNGVRTSPQPLIIIQYHVPNGTGKKRSGTSNKMQIEISKVVQKLLVNYIHINIELRNNLSPAGKILQTILTVNGFPYTNMKFQVLFSELKPALGIPENQSRARVRQKLDPSLNLMKKEEFIADWEWLGKGVKNKPFYLVIYPTHTNNDPGHRIMNMPPAE
jgi:hypothetical protein